jgi:hypothetical protein
MPTLSKISAISWSEGIFLGYGKIEDHKAYHLYDKQRKVLSFKKKVIFNEVVMVLKKK